MNSLVIKTLWLIFILVNCANAVIFRIRARRIVAEKPDLKPGYDRIFRGLMLWGNLPYIVMGFGTIYGGVSNIFEFINYKSTNIYVKLWISTIAIELAIGFYWIYFKSGAEMLVDHPGLFNIDFQSPRDVKLFIGACIAFVFMLFMCKP